MPDFIDISDLPSEALVAILDSAQEIKAKLKQGETWQPLLGKQLAMIFEKPSTRTRVSFEVGIHQLGGQAIIINADQSQLGRGEPVSDTAQVLSRYVDIIMIRCHTHDFALEFAKHASVPVINGLTGDSHPCQIMADILTFIEHRGTIKGKKIAWIGDGNNVAASWVHAAARFGFTLSVATPASLALPEKVINWAKANNADIHVTESPEGAVADADLVTTDTWVSMGDKDADSRHALLMPYQVTDKLMQKAKADALFMHCLPAHRDEEVSASVIDGAQSVIYDEAENRLHIQKAIMIWCLKNTPPIG